MMYPKYKEDIELVDNYSHLLTLEKDRTPAFIFNQSERRLTYRHLQKISRRQADD